MNLQIRINLSFFEILTLILIISKLFDKLSWSWTFIWLWAILLQFLKARKRNLIYNNGGKNK